MLESHRRCSLSVSNSLFTKLKAICSTTPFRTQSARTNSKCVKCDGEDLAYHPCKPLACKFIYVVLQLKWTRLRLCRGSRALSSSLDDGSKCASLYSRFFCFFGLYLNAFVAFRMYIYIYIQRMCMCLFFSVYRPVCVCINHCSTTYTDLEHTIQRSRRRSSKSSSL